ncbi:carbohydrate-binding family 9-like protein [Ochrovirga pacifica]|uniref:carbohydrate-binding family 9-like protein n=1 Tax=Ochrovirga pacifica TaxID=1042376 RepID=UPI0002557B8F|nr:carbohydrate-binding family 9-like protein [Ochrovirga pacifica]
MKLLFKHIYLLMIPCLLGCENTLNKELSLTDRPVYKVHKVKQAPVIDGVIDLKEWEHAETVSFDYYYLTENEQEQQPTQYRMLWDDENIYVSFQMEDRFINAKETQRDGAPYLDDCVELFLIPSPSAADVHICFEINPNKAVNDLVYVNNFHNGKNAPIRSFDPEITVEVSIQGTVNNNKDLDKGWALEMAIPVKTFRGIASQYPVAKGSQWAFLALKQMRDVDAIGRRMMSTLFPVENIKEKDVHQPNMFGLLMFVE